MPAPTMRRLRITDPRRAALALCALAGCGMEAGDAFAQSANSSTSPGAAQAAVVAPLQITAGTNLRFGQFANATTAGTITIDPFGTVSTTGGMIGANTFAQTAAGRGNATFRMTGNPNATVGITVSTNVQVVSGINRMSITGFTGNVANSAIVLDATGAYTLAVGATINVNANQAPGSYSGTYILTVTYQ